MSNQLYAALGKETRKFAFTTTILGIVERTLYAASAYLGRPEFIAGWLVLKVAGQWHLWEKEDRGRAAFNSFLSGTGLSLFFGFVGGRMVSWLQSCQFSKAAIVGVSLILFSILLISFAKAQHGKQGGWK